MLAGRRDVKFCTDIVGTMANFSDNGKTYHGAYGHRWRNHFGFDQLDLIIEALKKNPDDRRQVLQMWDAKADLGKEGKDFPCNTQVYFSIVHGKLDMTVCNRSNDIIWGAYGANAVHFSVLQEYMASSIGVEVGIYYQMSNNYHAYLKTFEPIEELSQMAGQDMWTYDPYVCKTVEPFPLMSTPKEIWDQDLDVFMKDGPIIGFRDPFFRRVATPIYLAHRAYKDGQGEERYEQALEILEQCGAKDWKLACEEWIQRRYAKFRNRLERAQDDGPNYDQTSQGS